MRWRSRRSSRPPASATTARASATSTSPAELATALDELAAPCVIERRVPLDAELSVLVARTPDGRTTVYPPAENHHVAGILDLTVVPARVDADVAAEAADLALRIAERLAFVGVLAVELFVSDGRLLVNELAPRPHNSGHWTLDARAHQPVRAAGASGVRAGPRGA